MTESIDEFVQFLRLDPEMTATDNDEIIQLLEKNNIEYKNPPGPGGSTVFMVKQSDFQKASLLYASTREGEDYFVNKRRPNLDKGKTV